MEEAIKALIKNYKGEMRKEIVGRTSDKKSKDWLAVIRSEGAEVVYDLVIADLEKLLKAKKK